MGRITSGIGLASGINSKDIIDQLMTLEAQPKLRLLQRIETENKKKAAYTDLQTRLTTVRLFGTSIKKPQTFRAADVKSTDEGIVTGTASAGAAAGSYRLSVARLVTSQQAVSKGFADFDRTKVGAGTLTLEIGGGDLATPTRIEELNGGAGIRRGQFRITDRSGKSTVIDTTDAVTLNDIVQKINTSLDVSVRAQIKNDAIHLVDQTGQSAVNFRVEDIGDGHAAEDLGIKANTASANIYGTRLAKLNPASAIAKLNDGQGIGINASTPDFKVTMGDGTEYEVSLAGSKTMGDVLTRINQAIGAKGYADFSADGKGIRIVDNSIDYYDPDNPPTTTISIASMNGSTAAQDLGIEGAGDATGHIDGGTLSAGINTTMVRSLRGGQGLDLGVIRIQDRAGTVSNIDLAGAQTVEEILTRINDASVNVLAEVKPGGNSITITDKTNRFNTLTISDLTGSAAAQLGIGGSFDLSTKNQVISGANLQKAWFNRQTPLGDLNSGKGVPEGKFRITDSAGKTRTITVNASDATVGDLIDKINVGTGFGVKASINANGDGLLLTDTAGGGLAMKVEELDNGTVAKALNLAGSAAGPTIDGSWEKTIAIGADDTLADVQKKITDLGWGVSAAIINDGSAETPYRLSLTSTATGRAGRTVFDSGAVGLGERVLVEAQDSAVFVGSEGAGQPMLVTSGSNSIAGAIRGVTLNLNGVGKEPVTVNIARNVDNVVEAAAKFVEGFNGLITQLKTYTQFDTETKTRGTLLGDNAVQSVERELYGMLTTVGNASGKYRIAADVGIRVGEGGVVEFDEQKFRAAYADDPDAVTELFTRGGATIDNDFQLSNLRAGRGVRANPAGTPDFHISTKDGAGFDVDVSDLTTMGQILDAINNAAGNGGKVVASINAAGTAIELLDKTTTGTKRLEVSSLNGSIAASDLGLMVRSVNGKITGKKLIDGNAGDNGGLGVMIEKRVNRLIDPVNGVVSRASKAVDDRTDAFNDRIESIDRLVAAKRARLEKQFANLESSLSSLQGQQAALNSFTPAPVWSNS